MIHMHMPRLCETSAELDRIGRIFSVDFSSQSRRSSVAWTSEMIQRDTDKPVARILGREPRQLTNAANL